VNLVAGYRQSGQPRPRLPNPKVTPARVVSGPPSLGASASAPIAGRNDARTRQGRTLSLLDVLHQGRQGETGCKSRSISSPAISKTVCLLPRDWRRCWPPSWAGQPRTCHQCNHRRNRRPRSLGNSRLGLRVHAALSWRVVNLAGFHKPWQHRERRCDLLAAMVHGGVGVRYAVRVDLKVQIFPPSGKWREFLRPISLAPSQTCSPEKRAGSA
jgi:hypothetical protein